MKEPTTDELIRTIAQTSVPLSQRFLRQIARRLHQLDTINAELTRQLGEAQTRCEALEQVLKPTKATKVAFSGEFSFTREIVGDEDEATIEKLFIPWDSVKDIMKAMRERADEMERRAA
ncbi:hypothetical protein JCM16814_34500 [Desulfobaculum senezii]|jgi:predicted RNase H-like nuclease (RuvC/YqgF family)